MKLHVGTSGFSYREWKGKFYPAKLKVGEMLRFYGERFGAVEINNTFYRLPEPVVFRKWVAEVPADFKFALKAQSQITHIRRLRPARREVSALLKLGEALGDRIAPILFQLPPNFKKDATRLKNFLKALPATHRYAFEFRNDSWFDDEVFGLLRERKVALCLAESEETPKAPLVATTDWGYLRLRRLDYRPPDMKRWLAFVEAQEWSEAFVFFRHEETAVGPKFAGQFLRLIKNV